MKNTKINDSARGLPMTAATAAVASLDLISRREPPMACCPNDMEPLISTFKYPGAEFICMVCGSRYGFLAPTPQKETAELTRRHEQLRKMFDAGVEPGSESVS